MRRIAIAGVIVAFVLSATSPALACAGLIGPRGSVALGRTTTLSAYHDGIEHYVTSFQYQGGGGKFGSIIPLPAIPEKVERGGDWTLQRLVREVRPPQLTFAASGATAKSAAADRAEVVYQTKVDALDIIVLKGGAFSVGTWAKEHGFVLPPDAPAVLDFYAKRSPIFMAAIFDGDAAQQRGQQIGDGTPIHVTLRTPNPWIPLRILGLGKPRDEIVNADLFMLTDRYPTLLPAGATGLTIERREPASVSLLQDLRSDKGMEWVPASMWLTHIQLDAGAGGLRYDLAADVRGSHPSWLAAGLRHPSTPKPVVVAPATPGPTPVPVATAAPEPVVAIANASEHAPRSTTLPMAAAVLALTPATWTVVRLVRRRVR